MIAYKPHVMQPKINLPSFDIKPKNIKADNLILQKENTEKRYELIKQKALLIGGLTFAFFAIVTSIILYKKREAKTRAGIPKCHSRKSIENIKKSS